MERSTILSSVNHLFLWTIYTMAMLVITRWYGIRSNPSGDPRGDLEMLKSEDVQHSNEG